MRKLLYCAAMVSVMACSFMMTQDHAGDKLPARDAMLRLHVVAESNEAADQADKLLVRDVVLQLLGEDMQSVSSKEEARALVLSRLPQIEAAAKYALSQAGNDADVTAAIGVEAFPSIVYRGQIVPKGDYLALRIVIGEGAGRNWWCVLFPPLCYADVQYDDSIQADSNDPQELEIRWFFKEWLQEHK